MKYDPYRSYRQPSSREIWAGIKEDDKYRTCCLCGEVIGKEDFEPEYVGGFHAHSGCWQENAKLGHSLSLMRSKLMVEAKYINDGTSTVKDGEYAGKYVCQENKGITQPNR